MKKQRSYKLLSKTTFIYLVFTFIAFFSSAVFLTREAEEFINRDMERRFQKSENRIKHYIASGRPLENLSGSVRIMLLPDSTMKENSPLYSDTLIYNSESDDLQHFQKKTTVIKVDNQYYQAVLLKSTDDFIRLRDDIFQTLVPSFILLAISVVLFNFFLSGYLFRPFNAILRLMKTYKVGQKTDIQKIYTTTTEFKKMQELFHQMIGRIESDYRHLKEYTENMAHEIQTPLTIIRNKTETLIADEAVMKRQADTIKMIYNESNHLSKLGTTLNLITKIENREFSNTVMIATRPVIEKHLAAIHELVQLKSLSIEVELSEEHHLTIDPFLLDIILKNLLRNAISYGTTDGPIRVQTTVDRLSISNFGPPLDLPSEKLFERFFRNNHSRASLGLGLALVQKICVVNHLQIDYQFENSQHIFMIKSNPQFNKFM